MSTKRIKELLDMDTREVQEYPLPRPEPYIMDSSHNITRFAFAKKVLENKAFNESLKVMDAFSILNENNIDSYYNMGVDVLDAYLEYEETFTDAYDEISERELSEFAQEFLVEYTRHKFNRMFDDEESSDDVKGKKPSFGLKDDNWVKKILNKMGIDTTLDPKDLMLFALINNVRHGGSPLDMFSKFGESVVSDVLVLSEKSPPGMEGWIKSVKDKFQKQYPDNWEEVLYATAWEKYNEGKSVNETFNPDDLFGPDDNPYEMDDDIPYKEMKAVLSDHGWKEDGGIALWSHPDHPDLWLDGNTGKLFVYPTPPVEGPFGGSDDTFLETFDSMDEFVSWIESGKADAEAKRMIELGKENDWIGYVPESVDPLPRSSDDIHGNAEFQTHSREKCPKMASNVKSDAKKRLKELEQLISDYDSKKHFLGEKKPAIFNARDAIKYILDKCGSGATLADYKDAQIHFLKMKSTIMNLFPPSLVRYISMGDGKEYTNHPDYKEAAKDGD